MSGSQRRGAHWCEWSTNWVWYLRHWIRQLVCARTDQRACRRQAWSCCGKVLFALWRCTSDRFSMFSIWYLKLGPATEFMHVFLWPSNKACSTADMSSMFLNLKILHWRVWHPPHRAITPMACGLWVPRWCIFFFLFFSEGEHKPCLGRSGVAVALAVSGRGCCCNRCFFGWHIRC